ncbi:class I adenylate-forming enzyme family protein [Variovorax sp. M-6]|uniref:class I adenylate-forming enzyme family protein n=1 Tax=Variovorax sp. M-6 TaxID=3233041 RepID=UPI003F955FAD
MPVPHHNLGEVIARDAVRDAPWLVEIAANGSERVIEYAQLHADADGVARGLLRRGLSRGARVGLLAANSADYLIAFIGIMRAGMVAVPINFKLTRETIAHIEGDSAIALMFVDGERRHLVDASLPTVRLDEPGEWAGFLDPGAHSSPVMRDDEFGAILYTSGSTGQPKGVPLTHGSYVWGVDLLVASGPPMRGKRVLVAAPLFHMNGLLMCLLTTVAGGTVVLLCRFSGRAYLQAAAAQHCEVLTSVPTMLALAANETETIAGLDLSHVESIFTGSAPSTDALFDRMAQVFPNARVMNGYGSTESGPLVFGPHPDGRPRPKLSLGYPVAQIEWKLVGGPSENEGVLWLRSRLLMPGYLNLPEATAKRVDNGWYNTSDVMRRDADGFFFFVGRDDDLFICGGENIHPGEVEKMLERHPAVAQCAIVPLADAIKGQLPVAFIVPVPGTAPTVDEIKQFALANAPAYQHPRFVAFVDHLPLAGTNKVDRKALIASAAAQFRR